MVLAGRTNDPENVGAELLRLLGGNAAAVRKGIRKTDETPPRYAIPDVIEIVKGPGSLARELSRLRAQYPELFEKELDRVRRHYDVRDTNCIPNPNGAKDPNWIFACAVRFRDRGGNLNGKATPVATIHGIIDTLPASE